MVKWLTLLLGLSIPVMGATLSGKVLSQGGLPINGAKVIIYHNMALVLAQSGSSDRRGQYHFNLDPGPYQVLVLKKGFQPSYLEAMILRDNQTVDLEHDLTPELSLNQSPTNRNLKGVLRRSNRDPHKELEFTLPAMNSFTPTTNNQFAGSIATDSLQGLDGRLEQRSTVQLRVQINHQMTVESSLSNRFGRDGEKDTQHIQAGIRVKLPTIDLNLRGETISSTDAGELGGSKTFAVKGDYGRHIRGATGLNLIQSQEHNTIQQKISLSQNLTYEVMNQVIAQELKLTDWRQNHRKTGSHASLHTAWQLRRFKGFSLAADLGTWSFDRAANHGMTWWIMGRHGKTNQRFSIDSKIGIHREEDESGWVQNHRLQARIGPVRLEAEFKQEFEFQPFSSYQIFGSYLAQPLAPYTTESFYTNKLRETTLALRLPHGSHWESRLNWSDYGYNARLIHTDRENAFKTHSNYQSARYAYALSSQRLGAKIQLSHSNQESNGTSFDQSEISYSQALNPFQNKALGLLFEFEMKNQPSIPGWWLLSELPWNPEESQTWYEGRLRLQF